MRVLAISALAPLWLALPLVPVQAGELRIAAWNPEHLDDSEGGGCIGCWEMAPFHGALHLSPTGLVTRRMRPLGHDEKNFARTADHAG